jgi:hypothetical protein
MARRVLSGAGVLALTVAILGNGSRADASTAEGEPVDTAITTTLADEAFVRTSAPLTVKLATADGVAVADATVHVWRLIDGTWVKEGSVVTDKDGSAVKNVAIRTAGNRFKATYDGDEIMYNGSQSAAEVVNAVKGTGLALVRGAGRVEDGTMLPLTIRWRTEDGRKISGYVRLQTRRDGEWTTGARVHVSAGEVIYRVRPRYDTRYRVAAPASDWYTADVSPAKAIDNLPPGYVFRLPAGAPGPRIRTPAQPRVFEQRYNGVVSPIPNRTWRDMVGRTWHRGCPVGRHGLRVVRLNYWGFDGYLHRGELVVADHVAGRVTGIFRDLYRQKFPIRSIYRVDRFGWSGRLQGGNDYKSMSADNTSGFNCRGVVGNPSVTSPHSYGTSIDINTWENPYRSARGLEPNAYWDTMTTPWKVVYRSRSHPVVEIFRQHGYRWLGSADWQHFND